MSARTAKVERALAARPAGLLQAVNRHLVERPGANACSAVDSRRLEFTERQLTYEALAERSLACARAMAKKGVREGDRVILCVGDPHAFLATFLGATSSGVVSVPMPTLPELGMPAAFTERIRAVIADCKPSLMIIEKRAQWERRMDLAGLGVPVVDFEELESGAPARGPGKLSFPVRAPDEIAFLQYTSGSTGTPKGIVVTQGNLAANVFAIGERSKIGPADSGLSWLPIHHDMGLIGGLLFPLYWGIPTYILPPRSFVLRPASWLHAMHRFRATYSMGPTFAYSILLRKVPDADLKGIDLSSWRLALVGAERVDAATTVGFCERFAPYGFRAETYFPSYGMAEATVALAFPLAGEKPRLDLVEQRALAAEGRAVPARPGDPLTVSFVSVGLPLDGHSIRIVKPRSRTECPERTLGEIVAIGPSISPYYFSQGTAKADRRGELRTGDVGYLADGRLYVVDRLKDLVIIAGQNFLPTDIELCVAGTRGVRAGRVVAFAVPDEGGTEALVLSAEIDARRRIPRAKIKQQLSDRIERQLGIRPKDIVLVAPGATPLTTSGKLRRQACRDLYLERKLKEVTPLALRLMRLRRAWLKLVARFVLGGAA